jgi:recombinational DNA repair protein (RecF pathway)
MIKTELMVLKKLSYKETSLIIHGLSPEYGRLDLMAKGALKNSSGKFPAIDMFQVLKVEFKSNDKSSLHPIYEAELVMEHSSIAKNLESFVSGMKISTLILKNSHPGIPAPMTYATLINAIKKLAGDTAASKNWSFEQSIAAVKAVHLHENGMLPENFSMTDSLDKKQSKFIQELLKCAIKGTALPKCEEGYWKKLDNWLSALYEFHNLKIN